MFEMRRRSIRSRVSSVVERDQATDQTCERERRGIDESYRECDPARRRVARKLSHTKARSHEKRKRELTRTVAISPISNHFQLPLELGRSSSVSRVRQKTNPKTTIASLLRGGSSPALTSRARFSLSRGFYERHMTREEQMRRTK